MGIEADSKGITFARGWLFSSQYACKRSECQIRLHYHWRGTAGLCVAGRLAENTSNSILVIEVGKGNPLEEEMISTPALAFHLPETEYDWGYETTMVDSHGFKRVEKHNTRGKVLGGSSALNYFSWMRGSKGILSL